MRSALWLVRAVAFAGSLLLDFVERVLEQGALFVAGFATESAGIENGSGYRQRGQEETRQPVSHEEYVIRVGPGPRVARDQQDEGGQQAQRAEPAAPGFGGDGHEGKLTECGANQQREDGGSRQFQKPLRHGASLPATISSFGVRGIRNHISNVSEQHCFVVNVVLLAAGQSLPAPADGKNDVVALYRERIGARSRGRMVNCP